jgi:hypothetical protein
MTRLTEKFGVISALLLSNNVFSFCMNEFNFWVGGLLGCSFIHARVWMMIQCALVTHQHQGFCHHYSG